MKRLISSCLVVVACALSAAAQPEVPSVASGKIERVTDFPSKYIAPRNIDIWLPAGYSASEKYAVLYMHDGQMLYDPATTWNKTAWNVDDVAGQLMATNRVSKFIVVGIWNINKTRHADYFPQKPFASLSPTERDTVVAQLQRAGRTKELFQPQSDNYLKFIVQELKPYIDKHYSVYTNQANTFIAGSSMGGLISMYALCEYPKVFGGAACLSTHWVGSFTPLHNPVPAAFIKYLRQRLPNPKNHKIYFDCGDKTLDALYPEIQRQVDGVMTAKGYTARTWATKYFPGADHSETAWNQRLNIPLEFLFGK